MGPPKAAPAAATPSQKGGDKGGEKGGEQGGGKAGKGRGAKGGTGKGQKDATTPTQAKTLSELDDRSIEHESKVELLRAQRAAARSGKKSVRDDVRETEGVDEEDPTISVDDGIRIEPFNMRREMAEGHFDEGGFYILNKDEEKEVTDAWLDTIDKAKKRETFQQMDRLKQAGKTAASRLEALSRNLGTEEEEQEEENAGAEAAEEAPKQQQAKKKPEEEEPEEPADIVDTLEALIVELGPLQTPNAALATWSRAGREASKREAAGEPLKLRSRIRQQRKAAANASQRGADGQASSAGTQRPGKRKFDEFGYGEEVLVSKKAATGDTKDGKHASIVDTSADAASKSNVTADEAAIAAAAEKIAARDRADAEAAAAAAAETARKTRWTVYMEGDGENDDVEEVVNLNADDIAPKVSKAQPADAEAPAAAEAAEPAAATATSSRKRASEVDSGELQRRKKIERLTDLCDKLLERGVLVYDSTREMLAIEVRERRGERLAADKEAEEQMGGAAAAAADDFFAKRRAQAQAGDAKEEDKPMDGAAADAADDFFAKRRAQAKAAAAQGEDKPMDGAAADAADDFFAKRRAQAKAAAAQEEDRPMEGAAADAADDFFAKRRAQAKAAAAEEQDKPMDGAAAAAADDFFAKRRAQAKAAASSEEDKPMDGAAEAAADDFFAKRRAQAKAGASEEADAAPAAPEASTGDDAAAAAEQPQPQQPIQYVYDNRRLNLGADGADAAAGSVVDATAADTASMAVTASEALLWQFRWAATPGETYGPFDSVTMQGWLMQGCFSEERPAEIRQCDSSNQPREHCWHSWEKVDFELYI